MKFIIFIRSCKVYIYKILMTIYALSSGPGISGIAVIRISGRETSKAIKLLTGKSVPKPRVATLRKINTNQYF